MKNVVVSAVNIKVGGPHVVLTNFAFELNRLALDSGISVTYILSKEAKLEEMYGKIVRFNWPNNNYLFRCFFEYVYLFFFFFRSKTDLWISLNDSSPNVCAKKKIVYCHNPSPFYFRSIRDFFENPKFTVSSFFYKYVYRFNIHKNDIVIVQQFWLKKRFQELFKHRNIIVAKPIQFSRNLQFDYISKKNTKITNFIYPAYPRSFKNFEVICEAVQKLINRGVLNFNVVLTIDGTENSYSKKILLKFGNIKNISFIGINSYEKIQEIMQSSDSLIFPSRLETWGLPISEAINAGLYIIASDLEYAYETVGEYPFASFFPFHDSDKLSELMYGLIMSSHFQKSNSFFIKNDDFFYPDYKSLVGHCLSIINS